MWNQMHLDSPENDLCKYKNSSASEGFHDLIRLLSSGADILTEEHPIWNEIEVLGNIQAKYKRILHCDKCLQLLQRVGQCMKKMVLLNLSKSYLNLSERFVNGLENTKPMLIPSKQQLEYVLIRTQASAKLLCEALQYSKETFCYLIQKLRIGHLLLDLIMATSVTARLNIMFKATLVQICDLYQNLYPWLSKLEKGNWKWPNSLDLPANLQEWIMMQLPDVFSSKSSSNSEIDILANVFQKNSSSLVEPNVPVIDVEEEDEVYCIQMQQTDYGKVVPRVLDDNSSQDVSTIKSSQNVSSIKSSQDISNSPNGLLMKIYKANTLKKLRTIWKSLIASDELKLTKKKIDYINNLLEQVKDKKRNASLVCQKEKPFKGIAIKHAVRFRFAKYLKLVKSLKEYSSLASTHMSDHTDPLDSSFKPVKKLRELKELHKNLCAALKKSAKLEKCEELTKYYKGQRVAIKQLRKKGKLDLAKKITYYISRVLITMFQS